ncbi:hypothetical protein [Pseudofulvibacter geojedonensis]|uniref:Haemolysin activator HlyB C-terminal domain-containing protein n=1 Tax=Pseudofulvibacter geojedonensis TaxID=1123758 RepID=A0ABW3HZB6_9FLAO
MQNRLLFLFAIILCSFKNSFSQQKEQDSVWVSIYTTDSVTRYSKKFPYSGLFVKSIQLPAIDKKDYKKDFISLVKTDKQLLEQSLLNQSYSPEEIKGTTLQKKLREFEQLSYPFSSVITQALAEQIAIPNSESILVSYKGNVFKESKKTKTLNTNHAFLKINKHDSIVFNEQLYLRSRLLDFIVGNNSRSINNTEWILKAYNEKVEVLPYLSNYDNQFMRLEGTYSLISKLIPAYKHFSNYTVKIKDIKKISKELIGFDVNVLSTLSYEEWMSEVDFVKKNLTDLQIDSIKKKLPYTIKDRATEQLFEVLKGRIKNLELIATEYYNLISPHKIVKASNNSNIIVVNRKSNGVTNVNIYNEKEGKKSPINSYSFTKKNTKSIWVYGLDGSDYFEVNGESKLAIPISLIGGNHLDKYEINNGRGITIYDTKKQTNIVRSHKAKKVLFNDGYLVDNSLVKYKHSSYKISPVLGANPDDGIFIGALNTLRVNNFERNPFTQNHELEGVFYLGQIGFKLRYTGEVVNLVKDNNAFVSVGYQSPNYSTNFFGFGNETPNFDDNLKLKYNRVRMSVLNTQLGLVRKKKRYEAKVNFFLESIKVDKTPERFVSSETLFFPDDEFFDLKNYIGLNLGFKYKKIKLIEDLKLVPNLSVKSAVNLKDTQKIVTSIQPDVMLSYPVYKDKVWVDARLNYNYVFGKHLEFYQAASIGGNNGLRGYRNQRFTGQSSLFSNSDIKWYVKDLKSDVLPLQFGLISGFDAGRVWLAGESSNKLHTSYGAGFWLQSANLLKGSLMTFGSSEGIRFNFSVSFGL